MSSGTLSGGGGTNRAFPGRVPPIQFCERRTSPGILSAPRTPRIRRWWASHSNRVLSGSRLALSISFRAKVSAST
jgi:hypothetical protein